MLDLLLELLMNRLGIFILGVAIAIGGVYVWTNCRSEAKLYDAAVGSEGRGSKAKVTWKNEEQSRSDTAEQNTIVTYLKLSHEFEGEEIEVKHYVDDDVYAKYQEGDTIDIRFHPSSKQFVVIPETKRPSTLFASVAAIGLIILGVIIVVAVVISFL